MTKEQTKAEAAKILDDYILKAEQLMHEAKRNGTWSPGMDANNKLLSEVRKERDEKLRKLATVVDEH